MKVTLAPGWEVQAHAAGIAALERLAPALADATAAGAPVDTGELRDSVFAEMQGDSLIVGAEAGHAAEVELGTSKAPAQPFIRPAVLTQRKL